MNIKYFLETDSPYLERLFCAISHKTTPIVLIHR